MSPDGRALFDVYGYSHLLGPLFAVLALGVLVLLCRWVFSTTTRDRRTAQRRERAQATGDYGLLVPVATVRTTEDAEVLRSVLRAGGVRGTVAGTGDGGYAVLVFRADALRARDLVSS